MKKDKEWLKEEVMNLYPSHSEMYDHPDYLTVEKVNLINNFIDLIDQLDEPEVTLDRAFEKVAESYCMTKGEIWRHLERLETHGGKVTYDEPEVLSQEWIDKNSTLGQFITSKVINFDKFVKADKLKNLLVPKQDKPVIPQFVADLIEHYKRAGDCLGELLAHIEYDDVLKPKLKMLSEVVEWVYPNDFSNNEDRIDLIARAWLDGYEVEKEQKYYICLPNISGENEIYIWYEGKTNNYYTTNNKSIREVAGNKIQFTEQEIKDYDERYWAFAEEVTK